MFRTNKVMLIVVLIAVLLGVDAAASIAHAQVPALDRLAHTQLATTEPGATSPGVWGCFGQPPHVTGNTVMVLQNCAPEAQAVASLLMPPVDPVDLREPGNAPGRAALAPLPAGDVSSAKVVRMPVPAADAAPIATKVETPLFVVPLGDAVRIRARPVHGQVIDLVAQGEVLQVIEAPQDAAGKIGAEGEWIAVRTLDGTEGYTAAWLYAEPHAVAPDVVAAVESTPVPTTSPQKASSSVLYVVALNDGVRLRARPVDGAVVGVVAQGESVQVTEAVEAAQRKIGVEGEWLQAQTQDGTVGYTAAWLYAPLDEPATAATTTVTATTATTRSPGTLVTVSSAGPAVDVDRLSSLFVRAASDGVRVRARPVDGAVVDVVAAGDVIQVIEPAATARAKVGVADQWVKVRTVDGVEGYTAAWLYSIEDTSVPDVPVTTVGIGGGSEAGLRPAASRLFLTPKNDAIRVRAAPVNGAIVSVVNTGDLVEVLEPVEVALPKVGVDGQWVEVRDPDGETGFTAAWLYDVAEMTPVSAEVAVAPLEEVSGTANLELVPDGDSVEAIAGEPIPPLDSTITALGVTDSPAAASGTAPDAPESAANQPAASVPVGAFLPSAADVSEPVAPAEPQTLSGELVNPVMPVSVDVVDDIDVHSARIAVNNYPLATFTSAPFTFDLDTSLLSAGEYQLSFAVEDVAGMAWSDDVYFMVEVEDSAPDGATIAGAEDTTTAQPANATTVEPASTDNARRIVTIDGVERPFNFEFSIAAGLAPVTVAAPEVETSADEAPESLVEVLTRPFLSVIPSPVRTFLLGEHSTEASIVILIMVLILIPQGVFTLYWMTYTWNNPEAADQYASPREFYDPQVSFTALVPARREEAVIKDTVRAVDRIHYPEHMKEILILIRDEDDDATIRAAQEVIDELGKPNIRLITFTDGPRNKPNGLNKGLREATNDVVCIFDAEDEPHPDVYNVVNTVMVRDDADVVQSGVQLMNFQSSWFSAFNVLEYFFWFKSGLHAFTRQFQVTPLGGNTVFVKRYWLERVGGWDDQCLTEDADIGLRLTQLGARIQIVYDAEHSTQEETPDTVESFIRQRTRWAQGFYQVFFKWDWARLPSMKQKIVALYILLNSLLQAAMILFIPIGLVVALTQDVPVPVALISYIPIYILLMQLLTSLIGMREFAAAYQKRLPLFFTLRMIIFYYPYQLLLSVAAFRAVIRMVTRQQAWEKTTHSNLHRQSQLSGAA